MLKKYSIALMLSLAFMSTSYAGGKTPGIVKVTWNPNVAVWEFVGMMNVASNPAASAASDVGLVYNGYNFIVNGVDSTSTVGFSCFIDPAGPLGAKAQMIYEALNSNTILFAQSKSSSSSPCTTISANKSARVVP